MGKEVKAETVAIEILTTANQAKIKHKVIAELELLPYEQKRIRLGLFSAKKPPKGYWVGVSSRYVSDAIVSQVTSIGTQAKYTLIMHIANYSDSVVNATVGRL